MSAEQLAARVVERPDEGQRVEAAAKEMWEQEQKLDPALWPEGMAQEYRERATAVLAVAAHQPASPGIDSKDLYTWSCPDCGSGITKVHITIAGPVRCDKPPGYWSRG